MSSLIIITARGGSKGLKNKNIKILNGFPLIYYTIKEAIKIFNKKDIIVSTDSINIKKVSEKYGLNVPFLRPKDISGDKASSQDVLLHALNFIEKKRKIKYENVILLQPTSPLRKSKHIKECLSLFNKDIDMVASVKLTKSNPYYVLFEENNNGFLKKIKSSNVIRRQDLPKVWEFNGAVFVINRNSLKLKKITDFNKIIKYVMDDKSSIDIDDIYDFKLCEFILNENSKNNSQDRY